MCIPSKKNDGIQPKEHLRKERQKIMESMQIKHNKMLQMIDGWNGEIGLNDVKKKDMNEMPINICIDINEGVSIKRLENVGSLVVFDTLMTKGSEFGLHLHSDCEELCQVLEGEIHDLIKNKTLKKGEDIKYKKGEEHYIIALQESILKVYFD